MVVASGSMPAGVPSAFYKEIGELAQAANIPFLLDTSGKSLEYGIEGKPYLIKPNKEELCQYTGKSDLTLDEMIATAKEICSKGVKYVLISLGAEGALLVGTDIIFRADIPAITVVSPVGSGDSMVAGMAYALKNGLHLKNVYAGRVLVEWQMPGSHNWNSSEKNCSGAFIAN